MRDILGIDDPCRRRDVLLGKRDGKSCDAAVLDANIANAEWNNSQLRGLVRRFVAATLTSRHWL